MTTRPVRATAGSAEDIAAKKDAMQNALWEALRMPESQAREPDVSGGAGVDVLFSGAGADRLTDSHSPAALDPYQRELLDTIAGHEAPDYDVLYSPGSEFRRIQRGPDGQPDYSRHPNDPAQITNGPNKGKWSSAAGRYQILSPTWDSLSKSHTDLTDFTPANQDRAAWYLASERYSRETNGRDLAVDIRDPELYPQITSALREEWTSLPRGSEQGQGQAEFNRRMTDGLSRHQSTFGQP